MLKFKKKIPIYYIGEYSMDYLYKQYTIQQTQDIKEKEKVKA